MVVHERTGASMTQTDTAETLKERREGHMKDALALGGEEGRDKLR